MEGQFTIAEAKNNLPAIIHSVEKGPAVRISRHGRTVAVLLSIQEYERLNRKKTGLWRTLKKFRDRMEEEGIEILKEDFEGLRDLSAGRKVEMS